jgi:malate dehydrogenase (oxaloacetate-decarboxylating)
MPLHKTPQIPCALTGKSLLTTPHFNKGSAFPTSERTLFDLHGLLPSAIHTLEQQVERAYVQYSERTNNMAKNTFLASLKDQNTVLYYKLVQTHLKEMMEVVYTPTEGEAIENYSEIFRRPDGCFLEIGKVEDVEKCLAGWGGEDEVDYVVVTDGEEILGIGDQGVGGVLICTAKLVLMTLCGGLYPNRFVRQVSFFVGGNS